SLHCLQRVVWRRKVLVSRTVIMDREFDVVLLHELLDAGQYSWLARSHNQRHSRSLRIVEVLSHAFIGVVLESDHAAADNLEPGDLYPPSRRADLRRRSLVWKVHRLEVDVSRAKRLRHFNRLLAREIPQRIARDAELHSEVVGGPRGGRDASC